MSGDRSIEFFDRQFERQVNQSDTGFNPFEQAALPYLKGEVLDYAALEAMGEATALIRKSDVEPRVFMEVLNALFGSPVYENYGRMIADRAFEPAGFRLALGLKDVVLALDASRETAVPMPMAGVMRDQFLSAVAHGLEDVDWSAISEIAARNAGLT